MNDILYQVLRKAEFDEHAALAESQKYAEAYGSASFMVIAGARWQHERDMKILKVLAKQLEHVHGLLNNATEYCGEPALAQTEAALRGVLK